MKDEQKPRPQGAKYKKHIQYYHVLCIFLSRTLWHLCCLAQRISLQLNAEDSMDQHGRLRTRPCTTDTCTRSHPAALVAPLASPPLAQLPHPKTWPVLRPCTPQHLSVMAAQSQCRLPAAAVTCFVVVAAAIIEGLPVLPCCHAATLNDNQLQESSAHLREM